MRVRCPHCHNPIELIQEADLSDVSCPSCGSHFSLVADLVSTVTQRMETKTIGHFDLTERLGVGAFGEVWRAKDQHLDRPVAIKFPRRVDLSPEDSEKFFREARAAAQLKHPNIVSVHEVGRHEDLIFIVSDFIAGVTLADRLTQSPLTARETAELGITIAQALHHAHEHGIVHRDLKPSNVMMDDEGEPHVMDFGLAKRDAGEITMTVEGQLLGTPAYMPPEQASGTGHQADRRSDVYSLGVVLYEAVTGERPFRGNSRMLIQQVLKEDPPAPRSLNSAVPLELNTIILKCLEKDAERRYESAEELAKDLKRWLNNEPIQARPAGWLTRSQKWVQRHPTTSTLLSVIALAIISLFVVGIWYQNQLSDALNRAEAAREDADEERDTALRLAREKEQLLESEKEALQASTESLEKMTQAKRRLVKTMMDNGLMFLAESSFNRGIHLITLSLQEILSDSEELNSAALMNIALWQERMLSVNASIDHVTELRALQFSEDGSRLLSAGLDRRAQVWRTDTGEPVGAELKHSHQVEAAALSKDGMRVLTGDFEGTIRYLDAESGTSLFEPLATGDLVRAIHFSHDEAKGIAKGNGGNVRVFDCDDGQEISIEGLTDAKHSHIGVHPTQPLVLAATSETKTIGAWNIDSGEAYFEAIPFDEAVREFQLSPSGKWFAVATINQVFIYRTEDPESNPMELPVLGVSSISFSTDEEYVSTSGYSGQVVTWRMSNARVASRPLNFSGQVNTIRFVPNTLLLAITYQHSVRLWDPINNRAASQEQHNNWTSALSPDGTLMATGSGGSPIRVWGVNSLIADDRLLPHDNLILAAEFDSKGERVITGGQDEMAKLWSTRTGEQIGSSLVMPDVVSALAFHPKGDLFAVGAWDGTVRLFNATDASQIGQEMLHNEKVSRVSFSEDGGLLFTAGDDGMVRIWNGTTGEQAGNPLTHQTVIRDLAIHSNKNLLVSAVHGGEAILWDLKTRSRRHVFTHANSSEMTQVDISPDGTRILTADNKGYAKIWDSESGELVADGIHHKKAISAAEFSHDGSLVVTGSYDETARVWDAATGQPKTLALQHERSVLSVAFSPDDELVLTGSEDDTAQLWHTATGIHIGPSIRHKGKITVVKFNPDGKNFLTAHGTARLTEIPSLNVDPRVANDWVETFTGMSFAEDGTIVVLATEKWREKRKSFADATETSLTNRRLPISRLRSTSEGETGPFGQVYRSFNPRPKQQNQ